MSVLDKKLELYDGVTISGGAAQVLASNYVLDLGTGYDCWGQSIGPDLGNGNLWLNIQVSTALDADGFTAPVATFDLYTHTATPVTSGSIVATRRVDTEAAAGTKIHMGPLPAGIFKRYVGLVTTIGTTTLTAGAVDAWLSLDGEKDVPTT